MNNQSDQNLIRLLSIALIISLFSIAFLVGKYFKQIQKQSSVVLNTHLQNIRPSRNLKLPENQEDISDWQKYKNEKIGFEIQLPKTWQGYSVTSTNSVNLSSVGFSFKQNHQPFIIFQINQYTKVQWNSLKKNSMIKLIDQPNGSVLACDGCCSNTSDTTGGGQFDQFQIARCKEVPSILKTIKFVK